MKYLIPSDLYISEFGFANNGPKVLRRYCNLLSFSEETSLYFSKQSSRIRLSKSILKEKELMMESIEEDSICIMIVKP